MKHPSDEQIAIVGPIRRAFSFLTSLGYRAEETEAGVRFSSGDVFVNVYWDSRSFEVGMEMGLRAHPDEKYYAGDLLALANAEAPASPGFQATTVEAFTSSLEQLANLLKEHGREVLGGDRFAFKRLRDAQQRSSDQLLGAWRLEDIRSAAMEAWERKDLAELVRLFAPIESHLTKAERAKLEYARRHQ